MLRVTDVRVFPIRNGRVLLANASVTFDDCFVVTGFKVLNGSRGIFVSMPSTKADKPKDPLKPYVDTAFPINAVFRSYLNDRILEAYKNSQGGVDGDDLPM